jgi:aminoglycoside phosphotransferase family enzyme/predicted kinase
VSGTAFAAVYETHAAVVFLVGDRAYKLKKSVNLEFLDFTRRSDRLAVCRDEVVLNRRLAPDVYLGVADVTGPDGQVCDHLVVMRRMPAERRLTTLVRAGVAVHDQVRRVARLLAAFHSTARRGPEISTEGGRDAILRRWTDSFRQVRPFLGQPLDAVVAEQIERLTMDFLAGRGPLFDDRIAARRVVDGHGDLLADDIFCLDDGPRVLDCIEFDNKLRWLDGLDDAAFLAMDLERLGTPALGERFLDWYAEFAADPAPLSLRHHYVAYRAFVRAKVACLRHAQGDRSAAADVALLAEITARHLRRGAVNLVLVGGLPGTGKSTLAGRLADRTGAVLISSDRVRKELAGLAPDAPAAAAYQRGIYTPAWTERTYAELRSRAERLLERGESVALDASWSRATHREQAWDLAGRTHSTLAELRCVAAPSVTVDRIRRRASSISDADEHIAEAMAASADPWPDAVTIRTDDLPDRSVDEAVHLVSHLITEGDVSDRKAARNPQLPKP